MTEKPGEASALDLHERGWTWLRRPANSLRFLVYARIYALASALRLTLPDATNAESLMPALAHWLGVLLLLTNGCMAGWALCALGCALSLALLSDQLTQTAFLLSCALAALACWPGSARRPTRMERDLPAAVRCATISVYGLAVLHKVNRGFLDPEISCANGGLRILARSLESRGLSAVAELLPAASGAVPLMYIGVELLVALLLVRRPRTGILAAAWLHLPLTIVFAPSFAFSMMSGWICFVSDHDLRGLWRTLRRRFASIVVATTLTGGLSSYLFARGRWQTDPDWCVKELLLWFVALWLLEDWGARRKSAPERTRTSRRGRIIAVTMAAGWTLNGLTPYLGLQFQHTGAMLSNLRIDPGCWNSLWAPESLRRHDPYLRIDSIHVGADRSVPRWAPVAYSKLYTAETLQRAQRQWCARTPHPVRIAGQHGGASFTLDDLCGSQPLPLAEPILPGFRAFQVNLGRECAQQCVH